MEHSHSLTSVTTETRQSTFFSLLLAAERRLRLEMDLRVRLKAEKFFLKFPWEAKFKMEAS